MLGGKITRGPDLFYRIMYCYFHRKYSVIVNYSIMTVFKVTLYVTCIKAIQALFAKKKKVDFSNLNQN